MYSREDDQMAEGVAVKFQAVPEKAPAPPSPRDQVAAVMGAWDRAKAAKLAADAAARQDEAADAVLASGAADKATADGLARRAADARAEADAAAQARAALAQERAAKQARLAALRRGRP